MQEVNIMLFKQEHTQSARETMVLPLDLTEKAASEYPKAVLLARSLEADRASLDSVHEYLMHKQEFTAEKATHAITEYLKYLVLVRATKEKLAPSDEGDIAWHAHILHTQLYEPFCRRHFGQFVHHVPSAPDSHPSEAFLERQNLLGELFYGPNSIYCSHHGHCVNHHDCVTNPNHCVGVTCSTH
jgi:hypothetical protein